MLLLGYTPVYSLLPQAKLYPPRPSLLACPNIAGTFPESCWQTVQTSFWENMSYTTWTEGWKATKEELRIRDGLEFPDKFIYFCTGSYHWLGFAISVNYCYTIMAGVHTCCESPHRYGDREMSPIIAYPYCIIRVSFTSIRTGFSFVLTAEINSSMQLVSGS